MKDSILVLNAGSSTVKFALFEQTGGEPEVLARGVRDWNPEAGLEDVGELIGGAPGSERIVAVGHRVAHGGAKFTAPVRVDRRVIEELERLAPLAPLHQPQNIAPMRLLAKRFPGMPQVACFDTAFHRTQSQVEQAYAIPAAMSERGLRRYGFHGLSYEYIAGALREADSSAAAGRVIVAHLGSGASLCAMRDGRSVATTMGFTALAGLPMGTRSGDLDPGVVLYLMNHLGMSGTAVQRMLYKESGLLGVSGISNDMRVLLASSEPRARLAVDIFVHRIAREIGSLAAALGGLDALVFTGGMGEHSAVVRERVCREAAWLGLAIDDDANARGAQRISSSSSRIAAFVIPTDEERVIARHTCRELFKP